MPHTKLYQQQKNHLNAHYAQKMNGKECMEMKSGPKNDTQIINNINNKLI